MIAVDTNLLVYAHREDAPFHHVAATCIRELAEGQRSWAIPWPCVMEFHAIVTHPRIYRPPTPVEMSLAQIDAWMESPTLSLLSESAMHWGRLRSLLSEGRVAGPLAHDARIAALCLTQGVAEFLSADRDFGRFPALVVRNPLVSRK